eukprot:1158912-Pelagomonas_calceolata.AAC.2
MLSEECSCARDPMQPSHSACGPATYAGTHPGWVITAVLLKVLQATACSPAMVLLMLLQQRPVLGAGRCQHDWLGAAVFVRRSDATPWCVAAQAGQRAFAAHG